jgi:FkbM family methyltransferase
LIEPQPRYFARLVESYRGFEGLTFVNAAIDRETGTRDLYRVQDERGESIDALAHLASLSHERLLDWQRQDGMSAPKGSHIGSVRVECRTFEDVLDAASYVDLLHIDAEGYDFQLLRLFDFARFAPALVRFEHVHLSRADWDEAVTLLAQYGYCTVQEEYDTTAYRKLI